MLYLSRLEMGDEKLWKIIFLFAVVVIGGLFGYNQYRIRRDMADYPPTGQFVTVDGITLHYIHKGSGKPVVFLHGGILTGSDFEKVLDLAAKHGYQAIAFDRPGYGHSERPKHKISPMDQAELIHQALNKLGIENPILVGHSWSGVLVLSYALAYPEDISGIVLLGAAMYREGYPAENGDPISTLVTTPIIGDFTLHTCLKSPLGTLLADRMLNATFAPEPVPPGYRKATHTLFLRPGQFKANREDVLAFPPAAEALSKRYKDIQLPVVMVVGEDDPFGTLEQAKRLKEDIPHARLLVKPDMAHMIPLHHPQLVIDTINMQ